jgi:sugar phosphate isomerase/epimerase
MKLRKPKLPVNESTAVRRRDFLRASAAPVALLSKLSATTLDLPIGCQVYPVREALGKDFEGTLRLLAGIGFKSIEMCSPQGYGGKDFGPLAGIKAADMRQKINSSGLVCESCHYTRRELKESLPERIAYAEELGLKQMILSSFAVRPDASMDEWMRAAAEMNKIGEQMKKAGIQAGFHNHDGEFKTLDGVLIYDKLMSELDPKLVRMQFQVAVVRMGFDAPTLFEKYPGRFISLHLQDWNPADKKMVAVGKGEVDWTKLFRAAKKAGVRNYFVELNLEQMKESYSYLRNLQV